MSNDVIIARPYARAAFEYAKNHDLKSWLIAIALLSEVANQTKIRALLRDPTVTPQQRLTVIKEICAGMLDQAQENFLATLASNKRLFCLSEIFNLFHQYYDEYKKLKEIDVYTPYPMSEAQKQQLINTLEKRFASDVLLHEHIDHSLIGGAVIRAGDQVIDGSVKGRLQRLATHLNLRENLCQ